MAQRFAGQHVVVTGATKNIGLAVSRAFAAEGASLVIAARSAESLDRTADELRSLGAPNVVTVPTDLTVVDDVEALGRTAAEALGGIDVLVNNALVDMGHDDLLSTPHDVWVRGLFGYVEAPVLLLRALADSMRERGGGSVVNMVSTAAFTPVPGLAAYGIAKAAMWAMTRTAAAELAPHIRVNAVCPGTTSPDGTTGGNPRWEALVDRIPLRRMATPEETVGAVLFLASQDSSYTTGQVVFVDGGRVSLT